MPTEPPSSTVAESATALGGSFWGVTVRLTVALLETAPLASLIV
jgi:hypothetical protein